MKFLYFLENQSYLCLISGIDFKINRYIYLFDPLPTQGEDEAVMRNKTDKQKVDLEGSMTPIKKIRCHGDEHEQQMLSTFRVLTKYPCKYIHVTGTACTMSRGKK